MKSLPIRLASAVVGILIVVAVTWFGGAQGLIFTSFLICLFGVREYSNLTLARWQLPNRIEIGFILAAAIVMYEIIFKNSSYLISVVAVGALTARILLLSRFDSTNEKIFTVMTTAIFGLFYSAFLPTFAIRLLQLKNGIAWFLFLLVVVFSGDIFAYFTGNLFGKNKLMPTISPNKTIEGAMGGVFGSLVGGLAFAHFFLTETSPLIIAVSSTLAAVLAQMGDLFESLVKRVADVKDSGRIMPGHGGILDRLDGVYFAAPLVYAVSQWSVLKI